MSLFKGDEPAKEVGPVPQFTRISGRITRYGYKSDRWADSASSGKGKFKVPTGAWDNALTPLGMAISPDVRTAFLEAGIKPKCSVEIRLVDGASIVRRWEDLTANDSEASRLHLKPLRGRFDLFCPNDEHKDLDGVRVVGFKPHV